MKMRNDLFRYDLCTILDYMEIKCNNVSGDKVDIYGGYSIEELENDPDFMLQFLCTSRKIKYLDFCKDEIKLNFDFIKGVLKDLNLRKDDSVIELVEKYCNNNNSDLFGQWVLTGGLANCYMPDKNKQLKFKWEFYVGYVIIRDICYRHALEKGEKNDMGFNFALNWFGNDKSGAIDLFAKEMIDEIFESDMLNLITLVLRIENQEQLSENDIKSIIDYVAKHDVALSKYDTKKIIERFRYWAFYELPDWLQDKYTGGYPILGRRPSHIISMVLNSMKKVFGKKINIPLETLESIISSKPSTAIEVLNALAQKLDEKDIEQAIVQHSLRFRFDQNIK